VGQGLNRRIQASRTAHTVERGPEQLPTTSRADCSEDFPANAKVGMIHVRALFGLGQRERNLTEVVSGHVGFQIDDCKFTTMEPLRPTIYNLQCEM